MDRITVFICLTAYLVIDSFSAILPDNPKTDFWVMKGTLPIHIFVDETDCFSESDCFLKIA
jgi:hypothetical protein